MEFKENQMLNEKIYMKKLSSGVKCYIIPKKDFVQKQVTLSINYGSSDNEFKTKDDDSFLKVPKGIAHYLEHKLFEEENGNVFETFANLGSIVNAYTSSDVTSYYFNCVDNFDRNLEELLGFVQRPYFTDENIEKEKGIIASEIKMYEDNPGFMLYYNMLYSLYFNNPVRDNIAGTLLSIEKINKELLYKCYNTFYTPWNMTIVCVGDLIPEVLFEKLDSLIQPKSQNDIIRSLPFEPTGIKQQEIKKQMPVAMPMYMIGIKDNNIDSLCMLQNIISAKLLLDIIIGESSPLYQLLYNSGVTDDSLSFDYVRGKNYAHNVILGNSNNPYQIKDNFFKEINRIKKEGINDSHFERLKKKCIGKFIIGFNSIENISLSQIDLSSKQSDLFSLMDCMLNIEKKDVIDYLENAVLEENSVLSIITP